MQPPWAINTGINQNKLHTDGRKQRVTKKVGKKNPQSYQFHHPW